MAPEMIKSYSTASQAEMSSGQAMVMKYPLKSDVYSFGMVCYEILTRDMPFSTTSSLGDVKKMLDGVRPPLPFECPVLLKSLIERCWSPDTDKLPQFGDICRELCYLKWLFLMPSAFNNVSPALQKSVQTSTMSTISAKAGGITGESIPIGFKREAHGRFQWMVGLDIGITHSGFAYAKGPQLHHMCVNYDYPNAEKPNWKALTALYYKLTSPGVISHCASWGRLARLDYLENVHNSQQGFYVPNFKLLLRMT